MKKHPKKLAVILLPTPMNRNCNRYLRDEIKDHPNACKLARLGLAAWKAQPESFPEIHELLFSRPILSPSEAEEKIAAIIPTRKLDVALDDPWIDEMLAADTSDYRFLAAKNIKMPKLLIVDTKVFQGVARTREIFIGLIEKTLGL